MKYYSRQHSWLRYSVCINQLTTWPYQFGCHDSTADHGYYPSLAAVDKLDIMINSVPISDTLEVNFDDVQIMKVL